MNFIFLTEPKRLHLISRVSEIGDFNYLTLLNGNNSNSSSNTKENEDNDFSPQITLIEKNKEFFLEVRMSVQDLSKNNSPKGFLRNRTTRKRPIKIVEIASNFLPFDQWIHCSINVNETVCSSKFDYPNTTTKEKEKENENINNTFNDNIYENININLLGQKSEIDCVEKTNIELFIDGNLVRSKSIEGGRCPVYRNVIIGSIPLGLHLSFNEEECFSGSNNCYCDYSHINDNNNHNSDNNNHNNNNHNNNNHNNNSHNNNNNNNNNNNLDCNKSNSTDINDDYNNNNIDSNDIKASCDNNTTQNNINIKNLNNENNKDEHENRNLNKNRGSCDQFPLGLYLADMYWFPTATSTSTSSTPYSSKVFSSNSNSTPKNPQIPGSILGPKKCIPFDRNHRTQDPPSVLLKSSQSALYSSTALLETSTSLFLSKFENCFILLNEDIETINSIFQFFLCLIVCGDDAVIKRSFKSIRNLILNICPKFKSRKTHYNNKTTEKKYEKIIDVKNNNNDNDNNNNNNNNNKMENLLLKSIELLLNQLIDLVGILINSSASFNILNFELFDNFKDFESVTLLWSKRIFIYSNNLESEFRASNWSNITSIDSNSFLNYVMSLVLVAFQRNFIHSDFFNVEDNIVEFKDRNMHSCDDKNESKTENRNMYEYKNENEYRNDQNNKNEHENKNKKAPTKLNNDNNNNNRKSAIQLIAAMCAGGLCENLDLDANLNPSRRIDAAPCNIFTPKISKNNSLHEIQDYKQKTVDCRYPYSTHSSQFSRIISSSKLLNHSEQDKLSQEMNEIYQINNDNDIIPVLAFGEFFCTVKDNGKNTEIENICSNFSFPNIQNLKEKLLCMTSPNFENTYNDTESMTNNYNNDNNNNGNYVDNSDNDDNVNKKKELSDIQHSKIFEETSLLLAQLRCLLMQITITSNKPKGNNSNNTKTKEHYSNISNIMTKNIPNLISVASCDSVQNISLFLEKAKSTDLASIFSDIIQYCDILFIEKLYLRFWKIVRVQKISSIQPDEENKQVEGNQILNENNEISKTVNNNMNIDKDNLSKNQGLNPLGIAWYNGVKGDDNCPIVLLGGDVHITDGTKVRAALHFSSIASNPHTAINLNAMHGRWYYEVD